MATARRLLRAFPVRRDTDGTVRLGDPVEVTTPAEGLRLGRRSPSISAVALVAHDVLVSRRFTLEVAAALEDPGLRGVRWVALASDGIDLDGIPHDTGVTLERPGTPRARPLRVAGWADPAVALVDLRRLEETTAGSPPETFPELVHLGLTRRSPVFLTRWLRYARRSPTPSDGASPSGIPHDTARSVGLDLGAVRPDPSITVVVRTTGRRPRLLRRNLEALATAHERSEIAEVLVVATSEWGDPREALAELDGRHSSLPIGTLSVASSDVPSRSAALTAGLRGASGDYVWFVDDDDWVTPESVASLKGAVHAADRPVLVGRSDAYAEEWRDGQLVSRSFARTYHPDEWYRAFTGWNFLPVCSLVVPRRSALERLEGRRIDADLGEDYLLQLLVLTAPGTAVQVVDETIARISWREGGDNAVTMEDRGPWLREMTSHVSSLLDDPVLSMEAWWRLGEAIRELPYPEDGTDPGAPEAERPRSSPWRRLEARLRRRRGRS